MSNARIALFSALALFQLSALQTVFANDTTWTGGGGADDTWTNPANWTAGPPDGSTNTSIIRFGGASDTPLNNYGFAQFQSIFFQSGAGQFTLNGNALALYNRLENNSTSTQTVNLSEIVWVGSASGENLINAASGDIVLGSTITMNGNGFLNLSGANHVLRFNGVIRNGSATGAVGINDNVTVIYNNTNTYSGDTFVNAGDLRFSPNGSANSSIIRLGGTGANTPDATVSLGVAGTDTGVNVGSTLVVRPSSSGTQGTRLLRSLNTTGTNQYSGSVFLDAGLSVRSATGGTLLFQGGSIDIKGQTFTVDDNSGNVNTQGKVTINEVLGSSFAAGGSLVKNGAGTLILQGTSNTYTGTNSATLNANGTRIGGGILGIYGDGSLGLAPAGPYNNIQFTGSATLQDTANNISLNANRSISVASGATATFDSNGNTFTINGNINGAGGNIAKAGNGSVVLTTTNTFTGSTTVNTGTLNAGAAGALGSTSGVTLNSGGTLLLSNSGTNDRISDAAPITLNGGTLNTGGLQEHGATNNTQGMGAVTLQSSSIIDMASGNSIIAFANSSSQSPAWGTGKTLSIYNWSGTPVTGGGTDQLYFGNTTGGLLATQLAEFQFYSDAGMTPFNPGAIQLATGEVVPVPEPGTWIAGILAGVAIAYSQRRTFGRLLKLA
jgi:autotransporter-associated beta strand protein